MHRSSFTLIELLIVVAIIGILAAIAVPNFMNAQTRARVARVHSDQKALYTACKMYALDNSNWYPKHKHAPEQQAELTTPVPYMNSRPIDIFQEKKVLQTDEAKERYINWNLFYHIEPGSYFPVPGYVQGEYTDPARTLSMSILSFGPNLTAFDYAEYNPTNGILSYGDISTVLDRIRQDDWKRFDP